MIRERVIGDVVGRQRADAPTAPHVLGQQPLHHSGRPLGIDGPLPEEVTRIRRHRGDRGLIAIESEVVSPFVLPPKALFDLTGQPIGIRAEAAGEVVISEDVPDDIRPCPLGEGQP